MFQSSDMDPLTLYIIMGATSHKTLEHDNIHNVLKLSNRACVVKVETSHTLQ